MNKVTLLAIDIAKNVFQLHGADQTGKMILRKKVRRDKLTDFVANLPVCTIAMEACGGANYWLLFTAPLSSQYCKYIKRSFNKGAVVWR